MKHRRMLCLLTGTMVLSLTGCGSLTTSSTAEVTPTAAPTATPTPTPTLAPTSTPVPTPTAAPKIIGTKASAAKSVYISNNTDKLFRKVYVRQSGYEDWGNNLVPSESSIRASEKIQLYYTPGESDDVTYDLKWTDSSGNSYEMYSVQLSDMDSASLRLDSDEGILYLSYVSLTTKNEASTRDNSYSSSSQYWEDSTEESTEWYVYEPTTESITTQPTTQSTTQSTTQPTTQTYEEPTTQIYVEPTTETPVTEEPATSATTSSEDIYYYDDGGSTEEGDVIIWDENGDWE